MGSYFYPILSDSNLDLCLFFVMLFLFSALHEYRHACVAYKCGDLKVKNRISLNPIDHIGIIETILFPCVLLYITDFQFLLCSAKSVHISSFSYKERARNTASVAIAGPFINLFVIILVFFMMLLSRFFITPAEMETSGYLVHFLGNCVLINAFILVFHLIPIPPLDGFKIIEGFLPPQKILFLIIEFVGLFGFLLIFWLYPGIFQIIMKEYIWKIWTILWNCYAF